MTQEPSREEFTVRIKWLVWGRLALSSFLVGTLIFIQQRYRVYALPTAYLFAFLLALYALTAAFWYLQRRIANPAVHAYLQVSGDIVFVTVLVHLTGGIDSGFSLLYHLVIISASIVLYRRGGYLAASLSSILYGAMLDLQYYNVSFFVRSQNVAAAQVMYQVFNHILSFYVVAVLSGYLAERLRKARQELREKSVDFRDLKVLQEHILRSVGSGIITMDLSGNMASWNPAAEYITGYHHDEISGNWKEIFGEIIKGLFGHTDSLKKRPFRFNGQITKKDGSTALLGLTASLLKDENNAIRGIIIVFQDITKIVEMEERVQRQERLATVGSLAAGIAHEIRNPLASISGSIQVLQGEIDLKGDNKQLMDIVVRETDRLNAIITEFLDYARPKADQSELINLSAVLDETIMLLKNSRTFSEGIEIVCDMDQNIYLKADAQRLRQVFWNLMINACQAMPGGGRLTVASRLVALPEEAESWCEITVSDTGSGIPLDDRAKIFDPFFTTKADGTGLGLAIAYRIIEDHGGNIAVEGEPGAGTVFRIVLPMGDGAATEE